MKDFSPSVIDAIQRNRKLEAIKLLREETGIGLKDAKEAVDTFIRQHPEYGSSATVRRSNNALGPIAILAFATAMAYGLYKVFVD